MAIAAILLLALTRSEIIERFRASPIVQVDGLVQVIADCPTDMRREYQLPVAGYAADVCRSLYAGEGIRPRRFEEPGVVIHIGDIRTNVTNVVSRVVKRADGTAFTKIFLPAPGYGDRRALAMAVARAYFLALHGETVDDRRAWHTMISANPELRANETCSRLKAWSERGAYEDGMDDEDYLRLARKVLLPGRLTERELLQFASRLYLYPFNYGEPFCGKYTSLDFASAIDCVREDSRIRIAAFVKARQVLIFGAGRGEELQSAAEAYHQFLNELGRAEKSDEELLAMLSAADAKLKGIVL